MNLSALPALAGRVESEDPSDALREEIAKALGWKCIQGERYDYWTRPDLGGEHQLPDWLNNIDDADMLRVDWPMRLTLIDNLAMVSFYYQGSEIESMAPSEPRARTAAALRFIAFVAKKQDVDFNGS